MAVTTTTTTTMEGGGMVVGNTVSSQAKLEMNISRNGMTRGLRKRGGWGRELLAARVGDDYTRFMYLVLLLAENAEHGETPDCQRLPIYYGPRQKRKHHSTRER
jgi:hypothetical protein